MQVEKKMANTYFKENVNSFSALDLTPAPLVLITFWNISIVTMITYSSKGYPDFFYKSQTTVLPQLNQVLGEKTLWRLWKSPRAH